MNNTGIEWTDKSWNPITGCRRLCQSNGRIYCYAYYMAQRLAGRYGYPKDEPFRPTFHPDRLLEPFEIRKPQKIFTCSMGEFFDEAVDNVWRSLVFHAMSWCPQHTFLILTKQLCRAVDMLECTRLREEMPKNLWLGISQDGKTTNDDDIEWFRQLPRDFIPHKFVSFEPLLGPICSNLEGLDWVIIGAQTGPGAQQPKFEWIANILEEAYSWNIPIFLKNNLDMWLPSELIQQFPEAMP